MMNSKEQGHQEEQKGDPKSDKTKASSSSRTHWGGFRNPRIVRVSRSFGGKDRHSKVCTIRGLRDRRIRLSIPTAIQLYGLQDKLGLSQPSKVVDWLLDNTKDDIDKLPPLQMPPGSFGQHFNPLLESSSSSTFPYFFNQNSSSYVKGGGIKINDHVNGNDDQTMMDNRSKYGIPHGDSSRNIKLQCEKDKWNVSSNEQENLEGYNASQITPQNFFPILNQSSFQYNHPYYQLEANSNLSLSQFGSNIFSNHQAENQLYFCPSSTTIPTIVNPQFTTMENSSDPNRQINHFQFLNSTSQHLLPNPLIPTLHFISSPLKSHLFKNLHPQESDKNDGGSGS